MSILSHISSALSVLVESDGKCHSLGRLSHCVFCSSAAPSEHLGEFNHGTHLYIPNIWITFANIGLLSALHASRALTDKLWLKVCNQQETLADATHSRHQGAKGGSLLKYPRWGAHRSQGGLSVELQLDEGAN